MANTRRLLSIITPRIYVSHSQSRCYSYFPSHYYKPLVTVEAIEEAVNDKKKDIHYNRLKAARTTTIFSTLLDPAINELSSFIMRKGNRVLADKLVLKTLSKIKEIQLNKFYEADESSRESIDLDPISVYKKAISNCKPVLATKKLKKSGTWYNVPCYLPPGRANFYAMKFLIQGTVEKGNHERFTNVLAHVITNAANNEGKAVQMKIDLHKYCESNRAYSNYRWV